MLFSLIVGSLLLTWGWICSCCWSKSARYIILLMNFVKSLQTSYQLMSVGIGSKQGLLFSSDFSSSNSTDSTVLNKLMAFWLGAFCFISLLLWFFLHLYLLCFSFLLFTITSFLSVLFLLRTDLVGRMLSELIFRTWRDFIFHSKMTTYAVTTFSINL